jgi:hypothetical protein
MNAILVMVNVKVSNLVSIASHCPGNVPEPVNCEPPDKSNCDHNEPSAKSAAREFLSRRHGKWSIRRELWGEAPGVRVFPRVAFRAFPCDASTAIPKFFSQPKRPLRTAEII